jgi:hypothetical protein
MPEPKPKRSLHSILLQVAVIYVTVRQWMLVMQPDGKILYWLLIPVYIYALIAWGVKKGAKKNLRLGVVAVILLLLYYYSTLLWIIFHVGEEDSKTHSLYKQSVVNAISETPIMVYGSPIGLHVDMDMTVPDTLVYEKDQFGATPMGHMNDFCKKELLDEGSGWPGLSSPVSGELIRFNKAGNAVAAFRFESAHVSGSCASKPGAKTEIRLSYDFFPKKIVYADEDYARMCI